MKIARGLGAKSSTANFSTTKMDDDFSFDQLNELFGLFPDTFQYDDVLFQQNDLLLLPQTTTTATATATITPPLATQPVQIQSHQSQTEIISGPSNSSPVAISTRDKSPKDCKKKISHRDTERQRRQEMSSLYRSLRTLLPIQCLKGKRSASDHIHETVGYIKHLQNRVESLSRTRDGLKQQQNNPSSSSSPATETEYIFQSFSQTSVTVGPSMAGIEILMNTPYVGGVNLSRVISVLLQEGLSLIRCVSTRVEGRLLHTIETEVHRGRIIDQTELQQKLTDYCNNGYREIFRGSSSY